MACKTIFVTLIIAVASWDVVALPQKGREMALSSSAILPPLPDLPIPGSKTKVIGNQGPQAAQPRKEERAIHSTDSKLETSLDASSSPIVFKTDRAQELVF
jgi:hypothetical protein